MIRVAWTAVVVGCAAPPTGKAVGYADVAPVLEHHCVRCHTSAGRRDGGVELDQYASARSVRIRAACTALERDVIDAWPDVLRSDAAQPGTPPCAGWRPASMPPGAIEHATLAEQDLLVRWIATGAQP